MVMVVMVVTVVMVIMVMLMCENGGVDGGGKVEDKCD